MKSAAIGKTLQYFLRSIDGERETPAYGISLVSPLFNVDGSSKIKSSSTAEERKLSISAVNRVAIRRSSSLEGLKGLSCIAVFQSIYQPVSSESKAIVGVF